MENADNKQFYVVGNNLSLDFINTKIVMNGEPKDLLTDFQDFVSWSFKLDLLNEAQARKLFVNPVEDKKSFTEIIGFRENLRDLIENLSRGEKTQTRQIKEINKILATNSGHAEISKTDEGFEKKLRLNFDEPLKLLLPIAESAADLLCFGNLDYLRKCEGETCILYFYDTTKNHKRRWCSMSGCGNRAKAAAFYQRKKTKNV
ncbi:MAG: CGNR zinc finger domain-containing protein [Pyrinomonadaceae bacterium]|nr:CGNR zinc finger domain-containing protein [Pyrinomonadaceae bacterium]